MISDEQIRQLPDDPKLAFVEFERIIRDAITEDGEIDYRMVRKYVNLLYAFIDEYNLDTGIDTNRSIIQDRNFYDDIMETADRFSVRARIRENHGSPKDLISYINLNNDYREEIQNKLNTIRKIINAAEISESRRESLFKKLNALAAEVDKARTSMEAFTSMWLSMTEAAGEGAENLEPGIKILERLARIFGKAKAADEQELLPSSEPKALLGGPTEDASE